jgi:hypothetical protein
MLQFVLPSIITRNKSADKGFFGEGDVLPDAYNQL